MLFSRFDENYKSIGLGCTMNHKHWKHEENYTELFIITLIKISYKEKALKETRGRKDNYIQRNKDINNCRLLLENNAREMTG